MYVPECAIMCAVPSQEQRAGAECGSVTHLLGKKLARSINHVMRYGVIPIPSLLRLKLAFICRPDPSTDRQFDVVLPSHPFAMSDRDEDVYINRYLEAFQGPITRTESVSINAPSRENERDGVDTITTKSVSIRIA